MAKLVIFLAVLVFGTGITSGYQRDLLCSSSELRQIWYCIVPFGLSTLGLMNTDHCLLNDTMCMVANATANCLYGLELRPGCFYQLEFLIDNKLYYYDYPCTIKDIIQMCPGLNVEGYPCSPDDIEQIDKCVELFTNSISTIDSDCKPAEHMFECLNQTTIEEKCSAKTPEYVTDLLQHVNEKCTLTVIEQKCPKAKF